MAMSLTGLRDVVRGISDLDTADLPDSLLDTYIREGFQRIVSLERHYPFYEDDDTLATVSGTRAYNIAAMGDIREIKSITHSTGLGGVLQYIDDDEAEAMYSGSFDTSGRPIYWSLWSGEIRLWPKPDAVYTLNVRIYRNPSYTWLDTPYTASIDADEWFHVMVAYFALARVFQRQEDTEMAQLYMKEFETGVGLARTDLMKAPSVRPLILNGGRRGNGHRRWLDYLGGTMGV